MRWQWTGRQCDAMPDVLKDLVNATAGSLAYQFKVVLVPDKLIAPDSTLRPLSWQSIPYGRHEIHKVPNDKRGIYAFGICHPSTVYRSTHIFFTSA